MNVRSLAAAASLIALLALATGCAPSSPSDPAHGPALVEETPHTAPPTD